MSENGELTSKVCTKCNTERPIDQFNKNKRYTDGYISWCKPCMKEYQTKRLENPEAKEAEKKRQAEWYEENKAEAQARNNARCRERYHNEPGYKEKKNEQKKASVKKRRSVDPVYAEKRRKQGVQYRRERRARLLERDEHFTTQEWESLCKHYAYTCLKCGRKEPEIKLAADHVIPLTRGGADTIENIQPLCEVCNKQKFTKIVDYRPNWDGVAGKVPATPKQLKLQI